MGEVVARAIEIDHEHDPAEDIWRDVKPYLDGIRIGGADLLVGVYTRNDGGSEGRMKGSGLYLPGKTKDEDNYQGVTGLVLKCGPLAYKTDKSEGWFGREPPQPGDWVQFDIKTGHMARLGTRMVRIIQDTYILAVIDRPDILA